MVLTVTRVGGDQITQLALLAFPGHQSSRLSVSPPPHRPVLSSAQSRGGLGVLSRLCLVPYTGLSDLAPRVRACAGAVLLQWVGLRVSPRTDWFGFVLLCRGIKIRTTIAGCIIENFD